MVKEDWDWKSHESFEGSSQVIQALPKNILLEVLQMVDESTRDSTIWDVLKELDIHHMARTTDGDMIDIMKDDPWERY